MKAHLIKGSSAAKAYMAKLRSKKTKVGAVKKKAVKKAIVKKIAGNITEFVFEIYKRNENGEAIKNTKKIVKIKAATLLTAQNRLQRKYSNVNYLAELYDRKFIGKIKKSAPKKKAVKKAVAKSLHKDTKSHNVNIRVVSGVSKSKKLQKELKTKGLKLTHGYTVASRKIGSLQTDKIKKSLDWINMYNEQLDFWKSFNPGMDKNYKKQKLDSIKFYRKSLIEEKKHFTELKKLLK